MYITNLFKKYLSVNARNKIRWLLPSAAFKKSSYSQSGEDIIVNFLLTIISDNKQLKYLDVGANHPFHLSNTALLYKQGGSGILIEPDPYFAKLLRKSRPRDTVIECGVHFSGEETAKFFIMDTPTLNTFCEKEMIRYVGMGHKLISEQKVDLLGINEILENAGKLDFLNVDIEGLDREVLASVDWVRFRPKCVCVETIGYETKSAPKKLQDIVKLMNEAGYILYADTFINSIFVDSQCWQSHWDLKEKN